MQPRVRAESFMRGAMLITLSAIISRVLGAIYRPVGQIFLGDAGLSLVTAPNAAYQIIFAISSVGLNVAVSRLIAERLALEDYRGARRIFRVATWLFIVSGALFGLVFALASGWIASSMGFAEAEPGFLVLAPALFLVAILSLFRGLYQGMQQMAPSAVSQVLEQIARVVLGLALVAALTPVTLSYGASGFNAGNTLGILVGVIYSAWVYLKDRPTADWTTTAPGIESTEHASTLQVVGKILAISMPLSLIGAILPIMQLVDSSIVTNRLMDVGVAKDAAQQALSYLTNAATLRDLPPILTVALYTSLVPAVTESMALKRYDQARSRSNTAFRLAYLVGIPATVGLLAGAREAYSVFFTGPGFFVMAPLAWSTILLMVQQTSSGVLQGMGYIWISVRNMVIGVVIKTILTYWWTGIPWLHESGAAYATSAGIFAAAALNMWALRRRLGLRIWTPEHIVRPVLASLVMAGGIWLTSPLIFRLLPMARIPGLVTVGLGGFIYVVAIFLLGGVTENDLRMLPGMRPGVIRLLKRLRLLRGQTGEQRVDQGGE